MPLWGFTELIQKGRWNLRKVANCCKRVSPPTSSRRLSYHLCFVNWTHQEHRQLVETPTVLHAAVFAGACPTTITCGVLADACQGFHFDRAYTLFLGVVHDLPGKLVVTILHPPRFFAPTFPDGAGLGRVIVISAIHLPRFFLRRRMPGSPSRDTSAQRRWSCCVLPPSTTGTINVLAWMCQF
jgi:hypothetical protein